jgi:DNA modification methylase
MATNRAIIGASVSTKIAVNQLLKETAITQTECLDAQVGEAKPHQHRLVIPAHFAGPLDKFLLQPATVAARFQTLDWTFETAATNYLSHDIHPYPAKFIPQLPQQIIQLLTGRGERIWDPFGGSGTTALEGTLLDRFCLSTDVNPLAAIVGLAKTTTLSIEDERTLGAFGAELASLCADNIEFTAILERTRMRWSSYVPAIPNIDAWFHSIAIEELGYLRWRVQEMETEPVKNLCLAAFSRSVLRASYQDSETRYVAKRREVCRGEPLRAFAMHLSAIFKKARSLSSLLHFRKAEFRTVDLRHREAVQNIVQRNSIDLIVTSPPYANATDYHLYHRFRLFWLGYDPRSLANREIGSHLRHQKQNTGFTDYLSEMKSCLENMFFALRHGRYCGLVLGDSIFKGTTYSASEAITKIAKEVGFSHVVTIDRALHSTKRSFISPARRLRTEQVVILCKPDKRLFFKISPPSYKLWAYEEVLREAEIETLAHAKVVASDRAQTTIRVPSTQTRDLKRLVFSSSFASSEYAREQTWQSLLENGDGSKESSVRVRAARKDPKYVTHGLHAYKGKFYPQLAKALINLSAVRPGGRILDPFCGSGTVLLESYLNGFSGVGLDVNPLAIKIARAKIGILSTDAITRDRELAEFSDRLRAMPLKSGKLDLFQPAAREEVQSWFPLPVAEKIAWVLSEIDNVREVAVQEVLQILLSSIVRDVSHQEPKDLRIRRRKTPLSDAAVGELLRKKITEMRVRLRRFSEIENCAPERFLSQTAVVGDSRSAEDFLSANLINESVDLVVTSPPYATALPYVDTDRLSFLVLFQFTSSVRGGIENELIGNREIRQRARQSVDELIAVDDFKSIPSPTARMVIREIYSRNLKIPGGFRRQNTAALLYRYFQDMRSVFSNTARALVKGASAFVVIGDNRTTAGGKLVNIPSGVALTELADACKLSLKKVIPITVTQENRLNNKNGITTNDILWLTKR